MTNSLQNTTASEATAKLYLNEKYADFHFMFDVDGEIQKVPANKIILAILSPVFEKMFFGLMKESKEVEIVDASAGAFKEFLQFFYLDKVTLSMENIEAVARLADKYDVMDCVNTCAEFVKEKLSLNQMCWGYQLAIFVKNKTLIEFCEQNINKSSKEIFASEDFLRCDEETLKHILQLNLTCRETDVFNACVEWAKDACKQDGLDENRMENVRDQLGNHFELIRFGEMTIEEFIQIHTTYKELFTPEEFQDILLQITNAEYEPKIFTENPRYCVWDNTTAFECNRVRTDNLSQYVENPEVVSFSSNQTVLLGEILSGYTSNNGFGSQIGYEVDVSIVQLEDKTFHSTEKLKNVFSAKFKTWSNNQLVIVLPKPILIKPQTVYEIRVAGTDRNVYSGKWVPKVKLENGIEINFHRNPSLSYDNSSFGWISTLKFIKI